MDGAAGFNLATIAGKTGALGDMISGSLNKWNGDPELLDDMNDRTCTFFIYLDRQKNKHFRFKKRRNRNRSIWMNSKYGILSMLFFFCRLDSWKPRGGKKSLHRKVSSVCS
jgi:hypothetical protein